VKPLTVGVLALQGAFSKHIAMLRSLEVQAVEVRTAEELAACDALIIPGGESTTIMKQIHFIDLLETFVLFAKQKPVFGTCAGLILMSREIIGDPMKPFNLLDIDVERNAFGRQIESFHTNILLQLPHIRPYPFPALFIRAPRILRTGAQVKVLAHLENEPVLIRQGHFLGATFHPELGTDSAIHAYFLKMIKDT